jgi:hypothetical protein
MTLTVAEYTGILDRIDAIGAEHRQSSAELFEALRETNKSLALTRESQASCQARCWVRAESDRASVSVRAMVAPWVSALAACAALLLSAIAMLR